MEVASSDITVLLIGILNRRAQPAPDVSTPPTWHFVDQSGAFIEKKPLCVDQRRQKKKGRRSFDHRPFAVPGSEFWIIPRGLRCAARGPLPAPRSTPCRVPARARRRSAAAAPA